jgi:hypothetical protein
MLRFTTAFVVWLLATTAFAGDLESMPSADQLPSGYEAVDEVIPMIGQPYSTGGEMRHFFPGDPTYFVYKDKVIGTAIFFSREEMDRGLTFQDIALPSWTPPIDHFDLVQQSEGKQGSQPYVQVRLYFVGKDVLDVIRF